MSGYPVKIATDMLTDHLAALAAAAPYLAVMTSDPFAVTDPLTVEAPDYTRPHVTWTLHPRYIQLAADATFLNAPGHLSVAGFAGYDAAFNGTMGWYLKIRPFTTTAFGTFKVAAADVQVGYGPL